MVCVADGTGGVSGAAIAAEMFIAGVKRAIDAGMDDLDDRATWVGLLRALDEEIARDPVAGETTGIALVVSAASVVGASVGDSEAWLFTDGSLELTGNQNRKPRLGTGRARPKPFEAPGRGTLVVATDGLFHNATIDDIRAVARHDSPGTADALAKLPAGAGSRALPDDVAVVVGWLNSLE